MADIVERLEALKFGLHWPEIRNAIAEITSLRSRLEQAERERDEALEEAAKIADNLGSAYAMMHVGQAIRAKVTP